MGFRSASPLELITQFLLSQVGQEVSELSLSCVMLYPASSFDGGSSFLSSS